MIHVSFTPEIWSNEAYLTSNRGKNGVKGSSMVKQFVLSVDEAVHVHFLAFWKHWGLLWAFFCIKKS